MGFSELHTKKDYFSPRDDIVGDFIVPALKDAIRYDRATGFFSSYSLIDTSVGVCTLAKKNGKMRIITSPRLLEDDVKAIKEGYDLKETIKFAMVRDFEVPSSTDEENRLSLLAYLIAHNILEIKIAVMNDLEQYPDAIFHAKIGIMYDAEGDVIAFTGSANETRNGLGGNWDHVSVTKYCEDSSKVDGLSAVFEELWNNLDPTTTVFEMPEVISELINSHYTDSGVLELDNQLFLRNTRSIYFTCPKNIVIRDYQKNAVDSWENHDFHGLFNMCTGTGKTITALLSLERLYNSTNEKIFTIIVCPQRHLVDQWADNIRQFGVEPIIGYSGSPQKDWKSCLKREIMISNSRGRNNCLITTIASFSSEELQEWICDIKSKIALVVDEVHNIGSKQRIYSLPVNANYRLGLSATIDRYNDIQGTIKLREYFGQECIEFTLEQAVGVVLTNYKYHPIPCVMDDDEYNMFVEINKNIEMITSNISISENQKNKSIKLLKIRGLNLISGLKSKYGVLSTIVQQLEQQTHILVYCGKARWKGDLQDEDSVSDCTRLIEKATQILGINGVGLSISQFTYQEDPKERREIIREFTSGRTNVIAAMSCLDEGVDIPSIKTAIITSSSDNPKEYIQRRGRVLRRFPGKEYAEIYDLIAIPRDLDICNSSNVGVDVEKKLLSRELKRIVEFSRLCINQSESEDLIEMICDSYDTSLNSILNQYQEELEYE